MSKIIQAADLFCGAGGFSSGLVDAAKKAKVKINLVAINHWPIAIATHSSNHDFAEHLCENLDSVDPRKVIPGGKLDVLLASPECTHFSNARGGKPKHEQSRASAWHVVRWAEALRPECIIVENVREFMTWGPLGSRGQILKSRKGEAFQAWLAALRAHGYNVEFKILNAANYGDPTTRQRLFIVASRGRNPIPWPEPTHHEDPSVNGLFKRRLRGWKPAKDIIDWKNQGTSIFNRKKPLSPNTLRRIAAGLRKFSGIDLEGFLVKLQGTNDAADINSPVPTVTAKGRKLAVCKPYIVAAGGRKKGPRSTDKPAFAAMPKDGQAVVIPIILGQQSGSAPRGAGDPIPTISTRGAVRVGQAFILPQNTGGKPRSTKKPLNTVTTTSRGIGLAQASFILPKRGRYGNGNKPRSVKKPVQTVVPHHGAGHLVTPYIVNMKGKSKARSTKKPTVTQTTSRHQYLATPCLVAVNHGTDGKSGGPVSRTRSVKKPLPTVTAKNGWGVAKAFLVQYNGNSDAKSVKKPVPAISTKQRFALVEIEGEDYLLDIRFRMLTPRELARAQGFKDSYKFTGNVEQVVKQIGNAVPVNLATALCGEALKRWKNQGKRKK